MTTQTEELNLPVPERRKPLHVTSVKLDLTAVQTVMLPRMAAVLSIQEVKGEIVMWMLANPAAPEKARTFELLSTGQPVDVAIRRYLGTVLTDGGLFVWHVFERLSEL